VPDDDDSDKTPVRTPSGLLRLGLVPCPSCSPKGVTDYRIECDLCLDDEGRPARYVAVDTAIAWFKKQGEKEPDL
jgi:hypothetical protein